MQLLAANSLRNVAPSNTIFISHSVFHRELNFSFHSISLILCLLLLFFPSSFFSIFRNKINEVRGSSVAGEVGRFSRDSSVVNFYRRNAVRNLLLRCYAKLEGDAR